jgi:class 3 adenylate cyclase/glyoxylase-like metal-dependent hydrolase (beta-lactamase superfamily II)
MKRLDDKDAIKIADDIWWVGFADYEAGFSNNPYLLVDEDEAILFDPGPGHPLFRDMILQKIEQVTSLEKIRYVVAHHQDPDLCGLIPFIENTLSPDLVIIAHPRSAVFIPYYGVRKGILPVGDGDALELKSGRKIFFYHAPYLHFAGNMMSYDEKTASLFSGDIFAVFSREWSLYADESYTELAKSFIEHYVASKEPVLYAYEKIKSLKIERILPQHGGIILKDFEESLNMLKEAEPGQLLKELRNKPSPRQIEELLNAGKAWLKHWLKKEFEAESLDGLMEIAMQEGPSTVSLLIDSITEKAAKLNVANPLTFSRVHKWNEIWSLQSTQIVDSVRKRFLTRQYGLRFESDSSINDIIKQGLLAFKTDVAIVFIDIRGFTKWSAEKSPEAVVGTLEKELELIARIINSSGGRVNKIMGDGMLAYFPVSKLADCIGAALEIQEAIGENNMLPVGVGCDFGEVIMGDIGQEARLDYTLIGAPVNFAARMCDSAGPGETAVSRRFLEQLDDGFREKLQESRRIEKIEVKIKPGDPMLEGFLFTQDG